MRYQYILGVSVTERDEEYLELTDLPKTGEPSWVDALRVLDRQVLAKRRDEFFISRGGYVPGRVLFIKILPDFLLWKTEFQPVLDCFLYA